MGLCERARIWGLQPQTPTHFSLVAPKEKWGKEMRSNAALALGASGQALHRSDCNQPNEPANDRGAKRRAGIRPGLNTAVGHSPAVMDGAERRGMARWARGTEFFAPPVAPAVLAAFEDLARPVPGPTGGQVFAGALKRRSKSQSATLGFPERISFPPFFGRDQRKGVRVQGWTAPAGFHLEEQP